MGLADRGSAGCHPLARTASGCNRSRTGTSRDNHTAVPKGAAMYLEILHACRLTVDWGVDPQESGLRKVPEKLVSFLLATASTSMLVGCMSWGPTGPGRNGPGWRIGGSRWRLTRRRR
jgi:hypothetical protein